ncbi:MAG: polar amino acid transporter, inner rane subunit [Frankiales bacterium]|nr:polar amino acid transporter, inner rane subunit [Frankiales bacterium]
MTTPAPGASAVVAVDAWSPSPLQVERDRLRRRATLRSRLIAAVSTLAVGTLLVVAVTGSSGWPRVQAQFFDLATARDALPTVAHALLVNLEALLICGVLVPVFGMLIAIARTTQSPVTLPLRILAAAYTDLFRGTPLILVLLVIGFGVPGLRLPYVPTDPLFLGVVALTLTYTSYVAEVFRAGIEAVHPSQRAAARSLGLSYTQTLRFVVLPQAVRKVVSPLLNDLVSLQKDSGLISVIGAIDAVRQAQILTANLGNFTPYLVAGGLFVVMTIPLTRLTDYLAARDSRRRLAGGAL